MTHLHVCLLSSSRLLLSSACLMMSAGTRLVAYGQYVCNQGVPGVPPVYRLIRHVLVHLKRRRNLTCSGRASKCTGCTTGFALALVIDRRPWLKNLSSFNKSTGTNGTPATNPSYRRAFRCTTSIFVVVHPRAKAQSNQQLRVYHGVPARRLFIQYATPYM
jgi:hypothetical protein